MFKFKFKRTNALIALLDDPDQEGVRADLVTFFGPRAEVYLKVYEKLRARQPRTGFINTWSWPVFLGAFIWPFYRKMYALGALMILTPIVLSLLFGGAGAGGIVVTFAIIAKGDVRADRHGSHLQG